MDCSIIIPYHSNETYLALNLISLQKTVPDDVEIVIVVNNAQKTKLILPVDEKRFKILDIEQSIGYSKAINLGAKNSRGKYLIFSDCDTVFMQTDWLCNLKAFYVSNKKIGIASSKLINPSSNRIIDFGMGLSKYNNIHPFMDRKIEFSPVLQNRQVQMACSANMIIGKDLFMQMGMLDSDLHNYYQDTDLCLRLKDYKKECWVVASSEVYHRGSSSEIRRESYRADIKGYYVAKNFHRMEIDIEKYFIINYEYYKSYVTNLPNKLKYLVIDMTTIADGELYYDLIKKYFSIYDIYELKYSYRDASHIPLIDFLGANILMLNVPIIYLVDRFISLNDNSLWGAFRNCNNDIIIDRNTNIVSFNELKNN